MSLSGHLPQPTNTKKQPQQQLKGTSEQGSSLRGQNTQKQPSQQLKRLLQNASSLTGQTSKQQPTQGNKGIETSP